MIFTLTWSKVTANPLSKSTVYVTYVPNRGKWREYMLWKKDFVLSNVTLALDLQIQFKFAVYPLTKDILWVKFEPDWTKGGGRFAPDKYLTYKSALIFTFDLEIWFKVTAHALLKWYVCVKHEPSRAKWRVYKALTFDLDRFHTDRWMDRRKDGGDDLTDY